MAISSNSRLPVLMTSHPVAMRWSNATWPLPRGEHRMTNPVSSSLPTERRSLGRKQRGHHPPGPPWATATRNKLSFLRHALDFLLEMRERYGDTVSVPTLVGSLTLIFHPDGVRHVLQENHRNYNKDVP